jgi:beta-lactamase superfamily II metal-dependent hydrolase
MNLRRAARRAICVPRIAMIALFAWGLSWGQTRTSGALEIYVIDVEGGNSVLFVSPSRESLLIDTGNAGAAAARDAGRIEDAIKDAGLQQIDHLITTHWHADHFGGMADLASRVPIREFIDHGPNTQPAETWPPPSSISFKEAEEFFQNTYPQLYAKAKHTVAKAGDKISMTGLDVRVVTSAGQTIKTPLPHSGAPNPYCADFKAGSNNAEDPQSVGVSIAFGKFRTIHLGDLTKNKEFELVCPNNLIGAVDVLLGLHHGVASSSSVTFVDAIHPRVAIMNDGPQKGGAPETLKTVYSSPGLEDLWELHFSLLSGQEYTVPGMFIANMDDDQAPEVPIAPLSILPGQAAPAPPVHNGKAYWIKVAAHADGSFMVTNARNGFSKTYGVGPSRQGSRKTDQ